MPTLELVKRNGNRQATRLPFKASLGLIGNDAEIAFVRKEEESGAISVEYNNGSRVFLTSRLVEAIKAAT